MPRDQTPREEMEQRVDIVMQMMDSGIWKTTSEILLAEKWKISRGSVRRIAARASAIRVAIHKRFSNPETAKCELAATAAAIRNRALNEGNPTTIRKETVDERGAPVVTIRTTPNPSYQAAIQANDQLAKIYGVYSATEHKVTISGQVGQFLTIVREEAGDEIAERVALRMAELNPFEPPEERAEPRGRDQPKALADEEGDGDPGD